MSTYLRQYRVGDIVDIKVNGAVQKGLPFKVYHGKTGVVYNVTKTSVGVIIYKKVWGRYIEKRIKENAQKKKEARANGTVVEVKRQPAQPRPAHTLSLTDNPPETLTPLPYETTI